MRSLRPLFLLAFACGCVLATLGVAVAEAPPSDALEHLKPLGALVGDWVSEAKAPDGKPILRTISYKWVADQRYLRAQGHRIKMGVFHKIGKSRHSD